jgi:hypothetical protein
MPSGGKLLAARDAEGDVLAVGRGGHAASRAISSRPQTWSLTGFHRRRHPKRLVHPREIVMHEVERQRCLVVIGLLTEGVVSRVKRRMLMRMVS